MGSLSGERPTEILNLQLTGHPAWTKMPRDFL